MSTNFNPCRIIALFNQAGGVAKSTLTMNLGYQLAQLQHRVLGSVAKRRDQGKKSR